MFGAITPHYDRLNRLFSGRLDTRWRRLAARTALDGLRPCQRLLDVATGTGDLARALQLEAARLGHQPRVYGADFTRPMLDRAAIKFSKSGMGWIEADGTRLPFAPACCDALTIAFGLRNMVDRAGALAEFARVLRPGGRVVILEFGRPRNTLFRALYEFYSFGLMPRLGRLLSGTDAYLYLARSVREFWSADELSRRMENAGFESVRARPLMLGVVYLHTGVRRGAATETGGNP